MFDALTSAEVGAQHVELLPARTVLSLFSLDSVGTNGADGNNSTGTPRINVLDIPIPLGMPQPGK
jgi:hypothetical protein